MLWNGCGRSRRPVGATVGKLAQIALVALTVASWASGAPKNDKNIDQTEQSTWVYQHTYDEVFQACLDAIERMGLFVTEKDTDKGTISGKGSHVLSTGWASTQWIFDIHIEALNTKPETQVKIDCESIGKGYSAHFRKHAPPIFRRDLSSEVQKVLATYH